MSSSYNEKSATPVGSFTEQAMRLSGDVVESFAGEIEFEDAIQRASSASFHSAVGRKSVDRKFVPGEWNDVELGKASLASFLESVTVYDLMPSNSKILVFENVLPLSFAHRGLVENQCHSAPLWNTSQKELVGMLTCTDLMEVMRWAHVSGENVEKVMDFHSPASWRLLVADRMRSLNGDDDEGDKDKEVVPGYRAATSAAKHLVGKGIVPKERQELVVAAPDDSLLTACRLLWEKRIHRLPVTNPLSGTCMAVVTHLRILNYLVAHYKEERQLFDHGIKELGVGTFVDNGGSVVTITLDSPLIDAFNILGEKGISCVPVVDDKGVLLDLYCRSYITCFSEKRSLTDTLNLTVGEALMDIQNEYEEFAEALHVCKTSDTLQEIFVQFAGKRVHRMICINEQKKVEGVVSLSDLLSYFLK